LELSPLSRSSEAALNSLTAVSNIRSPPWRASNRSKRFRPVLVRFRDDGSYELLDGGRRIKIHLELGKPTRFEIVTADEAVIPLLILDANRRASTSAPAMRLRTMSRGSRYFTYSQGTPKTLVANCGTATSHAQRKRQTSPSRQPVLAANVAICAK
jgi:hypothetical protein